MKKKQKEFNKRNLFYSLFLASLLFCYGFYYSAPPSFLEVSQINSVSAPSQSQSLNEQIHRLDKKPEAIEKQPVKFNKKEKKPEQAILNDQTETLDKQSQKLNKVISLILKTAIGRELEPFINKLLVQEKIHLTYLEDGHYGESGEGCVVKDGEYFFEGFFMQLSEKLSIEETASTLVHEATHFLMIQKNIASSIKPKQPVSFFEISAFAVQHQFMTELQQLNLADPQTMFIGETETILEIMQNSYDYKKTASPDTYDLVLKQLVDYGYPLEELNRLVSPRSEKECTGLLN